MRLALRLQAAPAAVRGVVVGRLGGRHENGTLRAPLAGGQWAAVEVRPSGAGSEVVWEAPAPLRVPYFWWFAGPVQRWAARRALAHAAASLRAAVQGLPPPPPPRPPPFSPPAAYTAEQAAGLATVAAALAMAGFGASVGTQFVGMVGRSFAASDRALGAALAASRVGVLLALVAAGLADRHGRRLLLVASVGGVAAGNALSAAAPSLAVFAAGQVLVRGFVNAAYTVGFIAAIEEAPEGARAYTVAMLSLAAGAGYACGVLLLATGDLAPEAWRAAFWASAASCLLLPGLARRLKETGRYLEVAARGGRRGRPGEVVDSGYRGRFAVLVATAFLTNVFAAPSSQLTNRFLDAERGFGGFDIVVLEAVTGGLPWVAGLLAGGRLAESLGRRPVGAWALAAATAARMAFFLTDGPAMWTASALSAVFGAMSTTALGAFGVELFPTEVRGTANGLILVAGLAGSAAGLAGAGALAAPAGGLGRAVAACGVAALVAAALVPRLPEAAGRRLEEVSPSRL